MQVCGLIVEWNPLHNGHVFLMEQARILGAKQIVAVMSGHFVQRGEPALLSKWARTQAALACGADLVVELPLPWAISGAQGFAAGAVSLLDAFGCVDTLLFGSECGDINLLLEASSAVRSPAIKEALSSHLQSGMSFSAARQSAVQTIYGERTAGVLSHPNNILGVEYCSAIHAQHAALTPMTVARTGPAHDAGKAQHRYASASLIREKLRHGEDCSMWLPGASWDILVKEADKGLAPCRYEALETAVLAKLRQMTTKEFAALPDVSEGLENRLWRAAQSSVSLCQFLDTVKTKRYSHARIRRIALACFLGLTAADTQGLPPYLRILGMNETGRLLLRTAAASLPIVTQVRDIRKLHEESRHIFSLECRATDLWTLGLPQPVPCGMEQKQKFIK